MSMRRHGITNPAILALAVVAVAMLASCSTGSSSARPLEGGDGVSTASTGSTVAPPNDRASGALDPPDALDAPGASDAPGALAAVEADPAPAEASEPELAPYGPADDQLDLGWLADQAALVVLDAQVGARPGVIELAGLPDLADRIALGLEELGLDFTRSALADDNGDLGTSITVHDDPSAVLDRWPIRATTNADGAVEIRHQTRTALEHGIDIEVRPGAVDLAAPDAWPNAWLVAESAAPSQRAAELAGRPTEVIAWSNREAQRYVPEAVAFHDGGLSITTSSRRSSPDVAELPYDSGMVVARELFGWGSLSASIRLPEGNGLWPAIWLLDAEACEAPGRCAGYDGPSYHEIDLLEVRGQQPDEGHLSLHWWDERIRSSSVVTALDDTEIEVGLERRPGLLVWRIDGEVVAVVADRVDSFEHGPHRGAAMRLIVNTAVGGSFAGTREIGRDGGWLGDALVPADHPAELRATFDVLALRIETTG